MNDRRRDGATGEGTTGDGATDDGATGEGATETDAVDHRHMRRALALARRGLYSTDPNPRVGCVIAHGERIVGEGWHRYAGEPHAEVHALAAAGSEAAGATAYVTLEPCRHTGRTGPCTRALVEARVARVVAAVRDPDPRVAGQGFAALAAAGIEIGTGLLETEARALNRGFVSRFECGRPWVRCKLAATLDGRTATAAGESQWITGGAARAYLPPPSGPTLALRAGGRKLWGDYPFHEAAFLGGPGFAGVGDTRGVLRGFRKDRYAGDASAYANAELRFALGRVDFVLPGEFGAFLAADAGRVFFSGDPDPANRWHAGAGGGLWISFLERRQTLSLAVMRGEDLTGVYLRAGFLF